MDIPRRWKYPIYVVEMSIDSSVWIIWQHVPTTLSTYITIPTNMIPNEGPY